MDLELELCFAALHDPNSPASEMLDAIEYMQQVGGFNLPDVAASSNTCGGSQQRNLSARCRT